MIEIKKRNIVNKVNHNKQIQLSYSKNDLVKGKAKQILDAYQGQYAEKLAYIAIKELEYIFTKDTKKITLIRDYCLQEIKHAPQTARINKLNTIFNENNELHDDIELSLLKLYKIVDKYENIDLTKKENLELFCKELKKVPVFRMINISYSNGSMTAFMQNMRRR